MKLDATRIEDVPVPELSGLALRPNGVAGRELLAIGDKTSTLARAQLTEHELAWRLMDLAEFGLPRRTNQFEGIAAAADGHVLALRETPPVVFVFSLDDIASQELTLEDGDHPEVQGLFADASSGGEGLVVLRDGRLLVAKEKGPPLLVEFGPQGGTPQGVTADSFPSDGEPFTLTGHQIQALAAWELDGIDDVSDVALAGGLLYALSDRSQCIVAIELPLQPGAGHARVLERWDLNVPKRKDERRGKPEALVVVEDTFIVGLDTQTRLPICAGTGADRRRCRGLPQSWENWANNPHNKEC